MDLNFVLSNLEFPWAAISLDSPVEPAAVEQYRTWLTECRHADMRYLEKYDDLRQDPRTLLEGAHTLIAVAFPYFTEEKIHLPISLYARGRDYHEVVRELLTETASALPGKSRVCVDTAPLRERYWAQRAGLGFIGKNNQLIIPGLGSYFFLGFIINTKIYKTYTPYKSYNQCGSCQKCVDACPGGCLSTDGRGLDARRCLSYLTIEHRGSIPADHHPLTTLYGCDICQRVCPHNAGARPTPITDFHPSEEFAALTAEDIRKMTPEDFNRLFRHSAIKRTKLAGLQRNLSASEFFCNFAPEK